MRNMFYNIYGDAVNGYYFASVDLNDSTILDGVPSDQFFSSFEVTVLFDVQAFFDFYPDCMRIALTDLDGNPNLALNSMPLGSLKIDRNVFFDTDSLALAFGIQTSAPSPLLSLNGNGGEYLDGETVQVVSAKNSGVLTRNVIYIVKRSYHSLYADNAYIVVYDLESSEGYKLTCPETLLVRYVEPVIAP